MLFLTLACQNVFGGSDEEEDEDDGKVPSGGGGSGGECEWTAPGTSRTYDLSGMVRSGQDPDNDWKAEEDIQGFKFDYYFNICGDSIKGCNNHKTSASQYQVFFVLFFFFFFKFWALYSWNNFRYLGGLPLVVFHSVRLGVRTEKRMSTGQSLAMLPMTLCQVV